MIFGGLNDVEHTKMSFFATKIMTDASRPFPCEVKRSKQKKFGHVCLEKCQLRIKYDLVKRKGNS